MTPPPRERDPGCAGARAAAACLAVAALGCAAFLYAYWTNANTQAMGTGLAVGCAALAAALVFAARAVQPQGEVAAPRESPASPPAERAAAAAAWRDGAPLQERRRLLRSLAATGLGATGLVALSLLRSLLPWRNPYRALDSRVWRRGQRLLTADGQPVKADALPPGGMAIVFPEGQVGTERAQTVLLRVAPQRLPPAPGRAAWAPLGNLAFSRICTHAGCPVGLYLKTAHTLLCPCHQSTFDVLRGARPTGGPADRPLPQLPLYVDADGFLRAGGGFSQPPGPGFWSLPA
jgi:ubiquinol-cytochrome c reductase iron-sulfur subunit